MGLRDLVFKIIGEDLSRKAFESFRAGLKEAGAAMTGFDDRMKRAGGRMQEVGNLGTAVFGAGVTMGLRDMIRDSSEFEETLARIAQISGATAEQMARLREAALSAGDPLGVGAVDAAAAIEELVKVGLTAEEVLGGGLSAALTSTAAAGGRLEDSIAIASDAVKVFGIQTADMRSVADQVLGTINASKFGLDDYRQALGNAAGVAASSGVEFDDLNAALAATAHMFTSGMEAGTALKTLLQRLADPSDEARATMDRLGLSFYDAAGGLRSMADIAGEMDRALSDLTEEDRGAALAEMFGTDAVRSAAGLMQAGADGIREMDAAIKSADAGALAAARMDTATGAMKRFADARQELNIAVGASGVLDSFTEMTNGLAGIIGQVSEANPALLEFGATFSALGVAMSAAAVVIGGMVAVVGGPVAAVIAGVAAMGAAIWTFRDEIAAAWDWIKAQFEALPDWAEAMAGGVIHALQMMSSPLYAIRTAIDQVGAAFRWLTGEAGAAQAGVAGSAADMSAAVGREMSSMAGAMAAGSAAAADVDAAFAEMENNVTGNSYVPDMVDEIARQFGRLKSVMTDPAGAEVEKTDGLFSGMAETVAGRLGKLAGDGALTWESMWGEMLSTGTSYRNRILSDVGNGLADGLSAAIFGGGAAGGGMGGGLGGIAGSFLSNAFGSIFGNLPGFATGGVFSAASGRGGRDRNVAAFKVSKDEDVNITRRGEASAPPVIVNVYAQDVASFNRSRAQVGRAIARAAGAGARAS